MIKDCRLATLLLDKRSYPINFPYFFNAAMIDQALDDMLRHFGRREKVIYKLNHSNKIYRLMGETWGYGIANLARLPFSGNNTEKVGLGIVTVVSPAINKRKSIF